MENSAATTTASSCSSCCCVPELAVPGSGARSHCTPWSGGWGSSTSSSTEIDFGPFCCRLNPGFEFFKTFVFRFFTKFYSESLNTISCCFFSAVFQLSLALIFTSQFPEFSCQLIFFFASLLGKSQQSLERNDQNFMKFFLSIFFDIFSLGTHVWLLRGLRTE